MFSSDDIILGIVFSIRIVIVSGGVHILYPMHWDDLNFERSAYVPLQAYSQSKLANILHAKELARRLSSSGISVYSLHPGITPPLLTGLYKMISKHDKCVALEGAVNTELARHVKDQWYGRFLYPLLSLVLNTPESGAETTLYCALEESIREETGKYYSDCKRAKPHQNALNKEDQRRLWSMSEEMVGLKSSKKK